jgi:hypothetical protein
MNIGPAIHQYRYELPIFAAPPTWPPSRARRGLRRGSQSPRHRFIQEVAITTLGELTHTRPARSHPRQTRSTSRPRGRAPDDLSQLIFDRPRLLVQMARKRPESTFERLPRPESTHHSMASPTCRYSLDSSPPVHNSPIGTASTPAGARRRCMYAPIDGRRAGSAEMFPADATIPIMILDRL